MSPQLPEYPRTRHLADSGGGQSKHHCPFAELAGLHLVIEEKIDGSHCGLLFDEQAELRIFTRNTVLESPPLRRDFCLLDQLGREAIDELWVRPEFLAEIAASGQHWRARDELLNRLSQSVRP